MRQVELTTAWMVRLFSPLSLAGLSRTRWVDTRSFAAFCVNVNAAAVEVEAKTTNCGLTVSSTNKGCIALAKPMFVSFNPHRGNTINWKAGCGKPARPVWREGRPDSTGLPYPYRTVVAAGRAVAFNLSSLAGQAGKGRHAAAETLS